MRRVKSAKLHPAYQIARAISQNYGDTEDMVRVDDPDSIHDNLIIEPNPSIIKAHVRVYDVEYQADIDDRYDILIYDPSVGLPDHDITGAVEVIWDSQEGMSTGFYIPEDNQPYHAPLDHSIVFQSKNPMVTFGRDKRTDINIRFKQGSANWDNAYTIQFREQIDLTGDPETTCDKIILGYGGPGLQDPDMDTVIGFVLVPNTSASFPEPDEFHKDGADSWGKCNIDGEEAPGYTVSAVKDASSCYLPTDTWVNLHITYQNGTIMISTDYHQDGAWQIVRYEHWTLTEEQQNTLNNTPLYFCVGQTGCEVQSERGVNLIGQVIVITQD